LFLLSHSSGRYGRFDDSSQSKKLAFIIVSQRCIALTTHYRICR
jgi:hypothetical protein